MRLPALKPRHVIGVLQKLGFKEVRRTGSHFIFSHTETGKIVPVPVHGNKDIKRGTLRSIIKQSGLMPRDFLKYL